MSGVGSVLTSSYLSASAGSGKTYALSMRYCRQVMAGVEPDEICALTFTRPATREIFSAILERLLDGDVKPFPGSLSVDVALKRILEQLPRLQISTIDAFSAKIARLFAYELGFNPDLSLYEESKGAEWEEILREVVRRALRVTSQRSADELFEKFRLRGRGTSGMGRSVAERMRSFLNETKELLAAHPAGWGTLPAGTDVPQRCTERGAKVEQLLAYAETCPEAARLTAKTRENYALLLKEYHAEAEQLRHLYRLWGGKKWERAKKFAELAQEGCYGYGTAKAKIVLDGEGRAVAKALWEDLLARDLEQTAEHTYTLYAALIALDEASRAVHAESGKIGFSALTKALAEAVGGRLSLVDPKLLYVAYRMDAAIRHLMIDEFQDTSTEQWAVLKTMAHELASGKGHSFFYVGDTKQSIYGWRGGDATLFADTTRVPNVPAGEDLLVSYRSSPAVIDFVNRAMRFTDADLTAAQPWQQSVLAAWRAQWKDHRAKRQDAGYAAWVTLEGNQETWLTTLADAIAKRWRVLSQRKVSIAVLAPKSKPLRGDEQTAGLLKLLRERQVPCAIDGRMKVAETPMGQLVVRLLRWLGDPRATVWREVARRIGMEEISEKTPNQWMRIIVEEGFVAWLEHCFGTETALGKRLKPYDKEVLQAVSQGLEGLDARGEKEPLLAQRALESLEVPCTSNQNVVTLMTIHHSKGLTFDVVYTLLDDAFINEARVAYECGADWVLEKPILSEVYDRVEPLAQARERRNADAFRDGLCALYVAITRARHEQVVFAPKRSQASFGYRAGLLYPHFAETEEAYLGLEGATLAYAHGTETWWEAAKLPDAVAEVVTLPPWTCDRSERPLEVELPSESAKVSTLEELLSPQAQQGAHYGVSRHEAYAAIAWTDHPPKGHFREIFRQPAEPCELWRERSFAVTLTEGDEPRYVAGQFDRVHLYPAAKRAVIYDFKTTQTPGRTEAYDRQLRDYRTALAALTGYTPESIATYLLFTHDGSIEEVPHA